jgi:hypothetical protein
MTPYDRVRQAPLFAMALVILASSSKRSATLLNSHPTAFPACVAARSRAFSLPHDIARQGLQGVGAMIAHASRSTDRLDPDPAARSRSSLRRYGRARHISTICMKRSRTSGQRLDAANCGAFSAFMRQMENFCAQIIGHRGRTEGAPSRIQKQSLGRAIR